MTIFVISTNFAQENNHEIKNDLPYININEIERYNKSKLQIEDQWASHPTIKQRIEAIKKLNIPSEKVDNRISKNILKHFDKYAEKFTNKLFEYNMLTHTEEFLSEEEFREQYKSIKNRYLSYGEHNHPSFVCYIEAVNNVYNSIKNGWISFKGV